MECKGIDLCTDYWIELHLAECHSKNNEPIKYKCLGEECIEVFDTRLERHKHTKEDHGLKFNINNLVNQYHVKYEESMKRFLEIGKKYFTSSVQQYGTGKPYSRMSLKEREEERRKEAYYNTIKYTIDDYCFDIISTGAKLNFNKTRCNSCNNQFVSDHWYNLHYDENHKDEVPVKLDCFNADCDKKFYTLEGRGSHCKEEHGLEFDVNEYLKNGVQKEALKRVTR
ncbi:hypothetical protein CONCODRAFT_99562 [Conidiobolus coronatus NRRL 28638]|uniref:C2H2-type domain-containing protein n=1 Tax=Conidiobolus coronatus (strain ATCC 28846 / CBS 209.66 / NRRL 28638) TaxID=796925 RepID=A0A137P220_CONC2|nr:hypothetical protein CONCODRAFT_99562 [Conidiobolus coronatus NRRL 28638]|eukprot:KXN69087.1 hypothetical protein CONCODRAFT_99562 [Conidiobolus coronatus NRRL 28638]